MINVIKAPAAGGKTGKAIEIAIEQAKLGKNVYFLNNEETQESIMERVADIETDFGSGELIIGEIDGSRLVDLQDTIDRACVNASKSRKIDVLVIDFNGYADFSKEKSSMLIAMRDYLKRIEAVHEVDVYFTSQLMRDNQNEKKEFKATVDEIWRDNESDKERFDSKSIISIDVTKASHMLKERDHQVVLFQSTSGRYLGKLVDFKYYGFDE